MQIPKLLAALFC